jgi:dephospho-CoA kinase
LIEVSLSLGGRIGREAYVKKRWGFLTVKLPKARLGRMKVIGLTGGIASGKSTVAQFLAGLGAAVIDVDKVWHEALGADNELRQQIVAAFGDGILTPNREIDRKKLGEIVFGNPEALARLNNIMHPWMYKKVKAQLREYRQQGVRVVVLELPLLVEVPLSLRAGEPSLSDEVDEVWVTIAPESVVLRRLESKSGLSEPEALARIRSQLPSEEKIKRADVAIDTDCGLDKLEAKVKELWQKRALDTRL